MTQENVFHLPTPLQRLEMALREYLSRDAKNRDEWIINQEGICLTLAAARQEFTADIEFGQWCAESGFDLNADTRAAAIAMGEEPEAMRQCLQATDRRSLHTIYRYDFGRFRNISKPTSRRQPKLDVGKPSPQFEKAKEAYDDLVEKGETPTVAAVAKQAGVSSTPARIAVAHKRAESELDPTTPAEMAATTRKRFDLAVRKARMEIREELKAEVYRELDVYVRHVKERSDRAERILLSHKGVMSREAFRKIKACLHPDHNTFAFAAEALQLFSELEPVLVRAEEPTGSAPPIPETAAELMARRRR
jgi:hypothetical protein